MAPGDGCCIFELSFRNRDSVDLPRWCLPAVVLQSSVSIAELLSC